MRLDKCIQKHLRIGAKTARELIAAGKVAVDQKCVRNNLFSVNGFSHVSCEGKILQQYRAHYIMLNKPAGCVSATTDPEHQTVIDLINEPYAHELHIAGRLDKESTGLLLLTNDGIWSRTLTEPDEAIAKRYLVTTEKVIDKTAVEKFSQGFYFAYEDITTLPAELEIISNTHAIVTIYEGKYHQIKRMFHAIENRITSLHRLSIGEIELDVNLAPGEYKELTF